MLIVCPACTSSYEVQAEMLGQAGRSVRCTRCATTWFATPAEAPAQSTILMPSAGPRELQEAGGGEFGWTFEPEADFDGHPPRDGDPAKAGSEGDVNSGDGRFPVAQIPPGGGGALTVYDAPSLAPVLEGEIVAPRDGDEAHQTSENVEALAARRAKRAPRRKPPARSRRLPFAIVAMTAALGALLIWRKPVVQFAPQTASIYQAIGLPVNLRGLVFDGVKISRETADGITVLVVEGRIVNATARTLDVPRLRFGVRNTAGLEIYAWTAIPPQTILPPQDTVEFRSRLASPPADARDLVVRFFNRRDIVSSSR